MGLAGAEEVATLLLWENNTRRAAAAEGMKVQQGQCVVLPLRLKISNLNEEQTFLLIEHG